jgi:excisionase family DNA binding protein
MTAPDELLQALFEAMDEDARLAFVQALEPYRVSPTGDSADDHDIVGAARYANRHPKTIRRAIDCGELAARKVTSRWRVSTMDIDDWLERGGKTKKTDDAPSASTRKRSKASTAADAIRGGGA